MKKNLLLAALLSSLCLVSFCGCGKAVKVLKGKKSSEEIIGNALRIEEIKASVAGRYLKEKAGGRKTVVVFGFGTRDGKIGQAFLDAFRKSYGDVIDIELGKPADEELGDGPSLKSVEEALGEHKDAELIVFYGYSLPEDYRKLNCRASYFLFDTGSGVDSQIKSDIESGRIIGLVVLGPKPPRIRDDVEADEQEAFDKRYILIDKDNIGKHAEYFN